MRSISVLVLLAGVGVVQIIRRRLLLDYEMIAYFIEILAEKIGLILVLDSGLNIF